MSNEDRDLLPVEPESPTPHYDKLRELLNNHKLPESDQESVQRAIKRKGDDKVRTLVDELNEYKKFVELEVIWDSEADHMRSLFDPDEPGEEDVLGRGYF